MLLRKVLAAAALTISLLVAPTAAAAAAKAPALEDATAAVSRATDRDKTGTTTDQPTTTTSNPVILVGGLVGIAVAYEPLAARLRADGHQTFVYELPGLGLGDIVASAEALRGYVAQVRTTTGAAKVDIVGHSEGGIVSRYYLKYLGGTAEVERYLSLGSPHYGTYLANIAEFIGVGNCIGVLACRQMTIGSEFIGHLNVGDDTPGPVRYSTVRTLQDELVRPTATAALADGATNVLIQAYCPLRVVGHLGLILDGTTYTVIKAVLTDGAIRPDCSAA